MTFDGLHPTLRAIAASDISGNLVLSVRILGARPLRFPGMGFIVGVSMLSLLLIVCGRAISIAKNSLCDTIGDMGALRSIRCKRGHLFAEHEGKRAGQEGQRYCKLCVIERQREYRTKRAKNKSK